MAPCNPWQGTRVEVHPKRFARPKLLAWCWVLSLHVVAGCAVDHTGLGGLPDATPTDAGRTDASLCTEGETRPCGRNMGACTQGTSRCTGGEWSECEGGVRPTTETCDEAMVDEDCDGIANEECGCTPGATQRCGSETGECVLGEATCTADAIWGTCEGGTGPTTDSCDGVDNDCDGSTDEFVLIAYYEDRDSDGYGQPGPPLWACERPGGYVPNDADCDDQTAELAPGRVEVCDGLDNNCDGLADEGLRTNSYYLDTDGDGYGTGDRVLGCQPPSDQHIEEGGDCDDTNEDIHPEAPEECDLVDNDCNGLRDDGTPCEGSCHGFEYNSRIYIFCDRRRNWEDARDRCASYAGGAFELVTIHDALEQEWITTQSEIVNSGETWWIGLHDRNEEGTFQWDNGDAVTFDFWAFGEPNDESDEDCVTHNFDRGGSTPAGERRIGWNDIGCNHSRRYICEER